MYDIHYCVHTICISVKFQIQLISLIDICYVLVLSVILDILMKTDITDITYIND